jgi:hypothetical protein
MLAQVPPVFPPSRNNLTLANQYASTDMGFIVFFATIISPRVRNTPVSYSQAVDHPIDKCVTFGFAFAAL